MTQTATREPEAQPDPAETSTIDTRLAELVTYNRAVATLLVSRGLVRVDERDFLARIRDRIERQVVELRRAEETVNSEPDLGDTEAYEPEDDTNGNSDNGVYTDQPT